MMLIITGHCSSLRSVSSSKGAQAAVGMLDMKVSRFKNRSRGIVATELAGLVQAGHPQSGLQNQHPKNSSLQSKDVAEGRVCVQQLPTLPQWDRRGCKYQS